MAVVGAGLTFPAEVDSLAENPLMLAVAVHLKLFASWDYAFVKHPALYSIYVTSNHKMYNNMTPLIMCF